MTLAIFDLDNTLLGGDSDHAWGEFICEHNLIQASDYRAQNDHFYQQYEAGTLDINAYLRFSLQPLKGVSVNQAAQWHQQFMAEKITPMILPKAMALLQSHRDQGHTLLIITATNYFVTAPIARTLGVKHLLACDVEIIDGHYTGEPTGTPSFQAGKVTRLKNWLSERDETLAGAYFYSDSHNDLPLLDIVDKPVAVDADAKLTAVAKQKGWEQLSLR